MELPGELEKEILQVVEGEGLELVNIDYRRSGSGPMMRVDIDKEGGITVEDCELIAKQLGPLLDVIDAIPESYELQVSSPGLDRKFYKDEDYRRFIGELVRVRTTEMVGGLHVIIGELLSFDGETIVVVDPKSKKGKKYEVALKQIKETRLEPQF